MAKKKTFQPPKGMRDIEELEMAKRKFIFEIIRKTLDGFGFAEVQPVEVESFDTMAAKSGEDLKDEIYYFKDKAGRGLGLRFDLTVGIARMLAAKDFAKPAKVYSFGTCWRYDNTQLGRYRAFTQWDVEIFGPKAGLADAELIALNAEVYKNLGLKSYEFRINNRKIVEGILEYLGIKRGAQMEGAMRTIDKIAKLDENTLVSEFGKYKIPKVQAKEILNALKRKGKPKTLLRQIKKDFPKNMLINSAEEELGEMIKGLEAYGVLEKCILDLSIVRGIGYYTGLAFETFDPKNEDVGSFSSGGRFDGLMGIYGKEDVPATGFGGGLDRLMIILEKQGLMPGIDPAPEYYIAPVDKKLVPDAMRIAAALRLKKKTVEVDLMDRKLSKQFSYASKRGVKKVIVLGEKELKAKTLVVRDMATGKESKMKLKEI